MKIFLSYFMVFILGGITFVLAALVLDKYYYIESGQIEPAFVRQELELKKIENSVRNTYCSNLDDVTLISLLNRLISLYTNYSHSNNYDINRDYDLLLAHGRLSKIYDQSGQIKNAQREEELALAYYHLTVKNGGISDSEGIYKFIDSVDTNYCQVGVEE